jgi:hypothetical protein
LPKRGGGAGDALSTPKRRIHRAVAAKAATSEPHAKNNNKDHDNNDSADFDWRLEEADKEAAAHARVPTNKSPKITGPAPTAPSPPRQGNVEEANANANNNNNNNNALDKLGVDAEAEHAVIDSLLRLRDVREVRGIGSGWRKTNFINSTLAPFAGPRAVGGCQALPAARFCRRG